jgi:hypothetical protein
MVIIINNNYQNLITLLDWVDHFFDMGDHSLRPLKFNYIFRSGQSILRQGQLFVEMTKIWLHSLDRPYCYLDKGG